MRPLSGEHIEILKNKFVAYTKSFFSGCKDVNDHVVLKRDHTLRVCDEITNLARQMGPGKNEKPLAYIIALFHDLGRFAQYFNYKTFDDSISVNHAELSVKIIQSDGFLENIPSKYHEIIFRSILNHNRPFPDLSGNNEVALYSKLLRDADKLDIWHVITDDRLRKVIEKTEDEKEYFIPEAICKAFTHKKFVTLDLVNNDNDMRLLRISWIFDINFKETFKVIHKRGIIQNIFKLIPESERKNELEGIVYGYIEEKTGI
ncbi:MAG: HD domain-containing protein [Bacteroidales bacterium]